MKVKFGAIIVGGSGKIGGHVASKNRAGAYLRTKVTPTNPNTASQSAVRGILSSLSKSWGDLSDAQRLSFNNAVASFATTDIFGDIKNPSGFNLYVRLGANAIAAGELPATTAPAKVAIPYAAVSNASMDASAGTLSIGFSNTDLNDRVIRVTATKVLGPGVSFAKSEFRVIAVVGVADDVASCGTSYVVKFGSFNAGDNIQVGVQVLDPTGQTSTIQIVKATVVA